MATINTFSGFKFNTRAGKWSELMGVRSQEEKLGLTLLPIGIGSNKYLVEGLEGKKECLDLLLDFLNESVTKSLTVDEFINSNNFEFDNLCFTNKHIRASELVEDIQRAMEEGYKALVVTHNGGSTNRSLSEEDFHVILLDKKEESRYLPYFSLKIDAVEA